LGKGVINQRGWSESLKRLARGVKDQRGWGKVLTAKRVEEGCSQPEWLGRGVDNRRGWAKVLTAWGADNKKDLGK